MKTLHVSIDITGVRPLLMHSSQGADPLSDFAKLRKPLISKRVKTDADHTELARIDWYSGFYADKDKKPIILAEMLEATTIEGAKITKQGRVAKAKVLFPKNAVIRHDHPLGKDATIDDFWQDSRFRDARGVIVNKKRITRFRPVFPVWSITAVAQIIDLNVNDFVGYLETAGRLVGLGNYRPRFGLFEVGNVRVHE